MSLKDLLNKVKELSKELDQLRPISPERERRIMEKFRLDWNFNSNHIEGNQLSYGETKALLLYGITAQGKPLKDHIEIQGHDEALKYIEEVIKQTRPFTENFIRELHQMILKEPYEADAITPDGNPTKRLIQIGQYKTTPNHVLTKTGETFRFASPEETPAKMNDLVAWVRTELDRIEVSPVLLAAEFHYRFIRIHPFDDGNGRLVRILMNFILMMKGYPPVIIKTEKKDEYFGALQQADSGNLEFFFEYIGEQLVRSLDIMIKGAKGEPIEELDDVDKELALLKEQLKKEEDVRFSKNSETILVLWQNSFYNLFETVHNKLTQFDELFLTKIEGCYVNGGIGMMDGDRYNSDINRRFDEVIQLVKKREKLTDVNSKRIIEQQLSSNRFDTIVYQCTWDGFKKNRDNPFDLEVAIEVRFDKMKYHVKGGASSHEAFKLISRLYHEILSSSEIEMIANSLAKQTLANIKKNLNLPLHN